MTTPFEFKSNRFQSKKWIPNHPGWSLVRTALSLMATGNGIFIASLLVCIPVFIVLADNTLSPEDHQMVSGLLGCGVFLGGLLVFVAAFMYCFVPDVSQGRGAAMLAIGLIICSLIVTLARMWQTALEQQRTPTTTVAIDRGKDSTKLQSSTPVAQSGSNLFTLVYAALNFGVSFCLIWFLRAVALHFRNKSLIMQINVFLAVMMLLGILQVIFIFAQSQPTVAASGDGTMITPIVLGIYLMVSVVYMYLTLETRKAIYHGLLSQQSERMAARAASD
jgi:hypothetical protein